METNRCRMLELEADRRADGLLVSQDGGGDDRRSQDGAQIPANTHDDVPPLAGSWGGGPSPRNQHRDPGPAHLTVGPLPTEPLKADLRSFALNLMTFSLNWPVSHPNCEPLAAVGHRGNHGDVLLLSGGRSEVAVPGTDQRQLVETYRFNQSAAPFSRFLREELIWGWGAPRRILPLERRSWMFCWDTEMQSSPPPLSAPQNLDSLHPFCSCCCCTSTSGRTRRSSGSFTDEPETSGLI